MPTEFKVDAEVKSIVGSVVSCVELLASVLRTLGCVSTLTVVVSGLLELSRRGD